MAALLRLGAGKACRLLAANAIRNPLIYQRSSEILHKECILRACSTRFDALRYLSSETTAGEAVKEPSEIESQPTRGKKRFRYEKAPETRYDRDTRILGTIIVKKILLRTFENILLKEGKLTPLQAYQAIRNCGTQLLYERPEKRVEVAHYIWDKIIETDISQDGDKENLFKSFFSCKMLEYIKDSKMHVTEEVYSALVTAYGRTRDMESAKGVFDLMKENNLKPDTDNYTALLLVHAEIGDVEGIMELLDTPHILDFVQKNLRDFLITVSTRGEVNTAFLLLGYMKQPTNAFGLTTAENNERLFLRNTILSGQSIDTIMITIRELEKLGLFEPKKLYELALDNSYNARNPAAQDVFSLMAKHGFELDGRVLKYLLDSFSESSGNDLEMVVAFTKDMPFTSYSITVLAQLFMMTGNLDKLQQTIELAKKEGVKDKALIWGFEEYLLSKEFSPKQAVKIVEVLDKHINSAHEGIFTRLQNVDPDAIKENAEFLKRLIEAGLSHHLQPQCYTVMFKQLVNFRLSQDFYEFLRVMKEHQVPLSFHQYRPMLQMMSIDGKAEAAQFCFDKIKEENELVGLDYSRLIEAYGRCPISGIRKGLGDEKGIQKVKELYSEISLKGITMTKFARGVVYIAFLKSGEVEQAEDIKFIHGEGFPTFIVMNEFMRAYSQRGDVKKTLEYFEMLKEIHDERGMPAFVYNELIFCYGRHDDVVSQMKVLAEMDELGLKTVQRTFSPIVHSFCRRGDIKSALEIFRRAKEDGPFLGKSSLIVLLNTMVKLGQTEHFESVLEDCRHFFARVVRDRDDAQETIKKLVFACLHAEKYDLALKLMLENDVNLDSFTLSTPARNAGWKGEVQAVLNAIKFMKENNVDPKMLYRDLIRAYDFHRDLDAIKAVYNMIVEEGIEVGPAFHEIYKRTLIKYSERLSPGEVRQIASATQDEVDLDDESDSSSDEEVANTQEFERDSVTDVDEVKGPK
ncbi:Leucine-rich PPR motif-containing protein, mitochondrial [Stylophora pistillata]|uniref:Leucine-rich PPR motif-containing protein, mitochondrial n=1 Tax=Stylophora pistillata TaxID=50429 RepID=A0A2B4SAS6_STYPI|nr:Leucine-rich PPR motif-containing protein, mitochondrial [Stylophora pistillata]